MAGPMYRYPVDALTTGSSLGNYLTFVRFSAETDPEGFWSAVDDEFYLGRWTVRFERAGKAVPATETVFYPESQLTLYDDGVVGVEKQFFIPFSLDPHSTARPSDAQALHCLIRIVNRSANPLDLVIRHHLVFPAGPTTLFTKQAPGGQAAKRFSVSRDDHQWAVVTEGKPAEVRLFGSASRCSEASADDVSLRTDYAVTLNAGEHLSLSFQLACSPDGLSDAAAIYHLGQDSAALLVRSREEYLRLLSRTDIRTPDPVINRGTAWSKINTVRVQHRYRAGWGFTNDPPQDIVVVRDLAWYVLGSDYCTPDFSRDALRLGERWCFHPGGKLTEFIHANEEKPVQHDYRLNINDDTPLFCYALYHHALSTDDELTLAAVYPMMKRTCHWILNQRGRDGLVRCTAAGTNVWGICSWRNIIDGYTLSGAVTEINAECYYALLLTSDAAGRLGNETEAVHFRYQAETLRRAINLNLVSQSTGLYLLNNGNDGEDHHDVTGDLVFPAMFGVADEPMVRRILTALTDEDLWTPFGSRTVSRHEPAYDPDAGYQLVGGVWPNLTAWTAFCLRSEDPSRLAEGMRIIYRLSETTRPADYGNVVPGEFPERLHGETYASKGMAMSPWMPPTYLWLGVEGLWGLQPFADELTVVPAMPPDWKWMAVGNLVVRGESVSMFIVDGTLYASREVKSPMPVKTGRVIPILAGGPFSIALEIEGSAVVFVASEQPWTGDVVVESRGRKITVTCSLGANEAMLYQVPQPVRQNKPVL